MSWRDHPMTQKQAEFIKKIDACCDLVHFEGKTKGEASDYIQRYIESLKDSDTGFHEQDYELWDCYGDYFE